ncbi:putative F-box domain-containing protein [Seiridium cardinale]|uniref:F-box domain-containing protein n=1 Tax=Seiridium cardinale TaxID=138064 RepID=A0ABR2Y9T5_9PEZI
MTRNQPDPLQWHVDVPDRTLTRRYLAFGEKDLEEFTDGVKCISALRTAVSYGLAPQPTAMCQLANTFVPLQALDLQFWDPIVKNHSLRREYRAAFAKGLTTLHGKLPALEDLRISSNHSSCT